MGGGGGIGLSRGNILPAVLQQNITLMTDFLRNRSTMLTVISTSSSKCEKTFTNKLAAAVKWLKDQGLCDWIHVVAFQPYRGLPYALVAFRNKEQVRRSPLDGTVIECSRALAMTRAQLRIHSIKNEEAEVDEQET